MVAAVKTAIDEWQSEKEWRITARKQREILAQAEADRHMTKRKWAVTVDKNRPHSSRVRTVDRNFRLGKSEILIGWESFLGYANYLACEYDDLPLQDRLAMLKKPSFKPDTKTINVGEIVSLNTEKGWFLLQVEGFSGDKVKLKTVKVPKDMREIPNSRFEIRRTVLELCAAPSLRGDCDWRLEKPAPSMSVEKNGSGYIVYDKDGNPVMHKKTRAVAQVKARLIDNNLPTPIRYLTAVWLMNQKARTS